MTTSAPSLTSKPATASSRATAAATGASAKTQRGGPAFDDALTTARSARDRAHDEQPGQPVAGDASSQPAGAAASPDGEIPARAGEPTAVAEPGEPSPSSAVEAAEAPVADEPVDGAPPATIGGQVAVDLRTAALPAAFTAPVTVRSLNGLLLQGRAPAGAGNGTAPGTASALTEDATSATPAPRRFLLGDPGLGAPVEWPAETLSNDTTGSPDHRAGAAGADEPSGFAAAWSDDGSAEQAPASTAARTSASAPPPASPFVLTVTTFTVTVAAPPAREASAGDEHAQAASTLGPERGVATGKPNRKPSEPAAAESPRSAERAEAQALKAQVARGLAAAFTQQGGSGEVVLRLTPERLGAVRIDLRNQAGVVSGRIDVESAQVQKLVQASLPDLRAGLESRGLTVESLAVHVREPSDADARDASADALRPGLVSAADAPGTPFVERHPGHDPAVAASPWNGAGTDAQGGHAGDLSDQPPGRSPGQPTTRNDRTGDAEPSPGASPAVSLDLLTLRLDAVA